MKMVQMDENKRVKIRVGIMMCLEDAVKKAEQGDKETLRTLLNKISKDNAEQGYTVCKLTGNIYIQGKKYTSKDNVICIKENGIPMFTIYKDKKTGEGMIDVDYFELMTDDERKKLLNVNKDANK